VLAAEDLWKNTDNSVVFNSPVLKNGAVYGLSAGNDIFCINARDGKTAWSVASSSGSSGTAGSSPGQIASAPGGGGGERKGGRGGGGMGRSGFGSIVDAGSVMLAMTPSAELVVFEPSDSAYKEVARIKVAEGSTYAMPVPSGNRLFLKDQDSVMLLSVQ